MIGHWRRVRATIFLFTAAFPLLPSPTTAQASGQGFLFKQPTVQVGVHGGYTLARAGGSVLDFARSELTLNKRDFDASSWGLELAVRAKERLDIAFDVRFSRSEVGSEMREWVDQDNLPIQTDDHFRTGAGYTLARAGGSVLDFARSELTLNKRDFDASSWGLELAVRAKERLDIAFDVRFSRSEVGSEMREWVDQDNLPIQQTTTFVRVPVTVGAKFYLGDRGRAISQFPRS